jgi:hypothetical protein
MIEFEELLYPIFIAMSPRIVLERHQKILDKYGLDNFVKRNEFKRAREIYETARYAIGMTAKTNMLYWITPGERMKHQILILFGGERVRRRSCLPNALRWCNGKYMLMICLK